MQRLVVGVPVPADAVGLLVAVEGDPAPLKHLHRAQAGGPGADHADALISHVAEDERRAERRP
jgi:hypothetical protein